MRVLMVGGRWDADGGRPSGLFARIAARVAESHDATVRNGGDYGELPGLLGECAGYGCVFWMPDVPNQLGKERDVKAHAPRVMLVTSKRNDGARYGDRELVMRALAAKANLLVEFSRDAGTGRFRMRVLDPLGNEWHEGDDPAAAADAIMARVGFLASMRREGTSCEGPDAPVPGQPGFVAHVREVAEEVQALVPEDPDSPRFLGNASFRETRCMRTFPSFRGGDAAFVSRRNVEKRFIGEDDFVPVRLGDGRLMYRGAHKPSVDSPIQARLYQALPNINYMVHAHCYAEGAPFTERCVPCGALQEVDEVLAAIGRSGDGPDVRAYAVNLRGHGCILMAATLDEMPRPRLVARPMPERHGEGAGWPQDAAADASGQDEGEAASL